MAQSASSSAAVQRRTPASEQIASASAKVLSWWQPPMDGPSDSLNTEQPSQRRHDVLSCVSEQQRASCSSVGLVHLAVSEHLPVRPHPTKRSDSGLGDGGEGGGGRGCGRGCVGTGDGSEFGGSGGKCGKGVGGGGSGFGSWSLDQINSLSKPQPVHLVQPRRSSAAEQRRAFASLQMAAASTKLTPR